MKKFKFGLLPRVIVAILVGILFGHFLPDWGVRIFTTFSSLFNQFLQFLIPIIIVGLVTPAITDVGKGAGKMLAYTVLIAYGSTIFSGFLSYGVSLVTFPSIIDPSLASHAIAQGKIFAPFFEIKIPPFLDVMSALILSFLIGMGIIATNADTLKKCFHEFRDLLNWIIEKIVIPLLPVYVMTIFVDMTAVGKVATIIKSFLLVIVVIFVLTFFLLVFQFCVAGAISKRNPFRALITMLPAYVTALGTSSSAATIPVTLKQTIKNQVSPDVAGFVIPLCATIHISGSTLKIVACSIALMMMQGTSIDPFVFSGFIFMLGVTMVAAPGVPGGAIMASLGILHSILGFTPEQQGMMIALYIAMDSFGTASNVTGDGAIALIVDRIARHQKSMK